MGASVIWFIVSILVGIGIIVAGVYFEQHANKVSASHSHPKGEPSCFWCRWTQGGPLVGWLASLLGFAIPVATFCLTYQVA